MAKFKTLIVRFAPVLALGAVFFNAASWRW